MPIEPTLAIIVPIYNTETYLCQCIDSLLAQTFPNIMIICINDGSTDTSGAILKSYQEKDTRIHVITQENKGQGEARNTGIDYALQHKAQYIGFVDSDDFVNPTMYEELYTKAKQHKADLAYCDTILHDMNTHEEHVWISSTPPPVFPSLSRNIR